MKTTMKITGLVTLTLLSFSCGKQTEADKISEAQSCLNTATAANVSECVAKVDGLSSKGAYLIRCVGKFVEEGFSGSSTKISGMMSTISSSSGKTEGLAILSSMAFTSKSTMNLNLTSAQEAYDFCLSSGSKGLNLLASYVQISTVAAQIAGLLPTNGGTMTSGQMQAALDGLATASPATQAAAGAAAISAYQSNCTNGASASGDVCTQFGSVITASGGDPQAVGQMIGTCYKTPSTPGCQGFN